MTMNDNMAQNVLKVYYSRLMHDCKPLQSAVPPLQQHQIEACWRNLLPMGPLKEMGIKGLHDQNHAKPLPLYTSIPIL